MDMQYLVGRGFVSQTVGRKDESGRWVVTLVMSENITFPNGTSREESVTSSHENANFNEAHKAALQECLQQLQDLVYGRGFESLIEAVDYQNQLEASNGSETPTDEITPS